MIGGNKNYMLPDLNINIPCTKIKSSADLVIGEMLQGLRSRKPLSKQSTITSPSRQLPILAEVDVVIAGGETGGAPAGISAARADGIRIDLVEARCVLVLDDEHDVVSAQPVVSHEEAIVRDRREGFGQENAAL